MEEWLFTNQVSLSSKSLWEAARRITLDPEIERSLASALDEIREETILGKRLGIQGTPTLFINGIQIGAVSSRLLQVAIDAELGLPPPTAASAEALEKPR